MCTPAHAQPPTKRRRAATQKITELTDLERRLLAASKRSSQSGHAVRAESYARQAVAVRRERESWTILANNPSPPTPLPHLLPALLCVSLSVIDLFVASGNAARRLSRLVFAIGVVLCGIVIGTSTSQAWIGEPHVTTPEHWLTEFASRELLRKGGNGITRLFR